MSQLLGGAFLAVGVNGLRVYLGEQDVPLEGIGQVGLWACIAGLAVWTVLGFAAELSTVLVGPAQLAGHAFDIVDFSLVVVFVGSALLGAALYLRTNVVPKGAALALVIASVLTLVPALADYVLVFIPIWVFEIFRVVYGVGVDGLRPVGGAGSGGAEAGTGEVSLRKPLLLYSPKYLEGNFSEGRQTLDLLVVGTTPRRRQCCRVVS